jgi:SPP1 family predicted phage head-tail adaptor
MPHPGELRHRIILGRTVHSIDEDGYPEETDQVLGWVWCAVEDESFRRAAFLGQAETVERGLRFIIRWRADVDVGMWVLWRGQRHTITKLGEYDFKRRYLQLSTAATKGVSA